MSHEGAIFGRRIERTRDEIRAWVERLFGLGGLRALDDRFAGDTDLLLDRAVGRVIGSGRSAAGLVCSACNLEVESVAEGRKASREGIWEPCPRCGEWTLSRFYIVSVRRGDLARALFPWSGERRPRA